MNENFFRILGTATFLTGISISIYFRTKADKETGERVSTREEGRWMFLALRLGGLVLWLGAIAYLIVPSWLSWSKIGLPLWVRGIGVVTGVICNLLIYWLFKSLGNSVSPTVSTRTNHRLVRNGIYRHVRHPLYSVGSSFFFSFAIIADNWFFAMMAVLAFFLLILRLPNEEAHLIARFGNEYRDYMKTTGAFFPHIKI